MILSDALFVLCDISPAGHCIQEDLEDDGEGADDGEVKEPDAKKACRMCRMQNRSGLIWQWAMTFNMNEGTHVPSSKLSSKNQQ